MFKNRKNKLMAVAAMIILSMSAWQARGMDGLDRDEIERKIQSFESLEEKVDAAIKYGFVNEYKDNGVTLIYEACLNNSLEMVRLLLDSGAIESINKSNNYGRTPLYLACFNNNLDMVRLLLENGAEESINKQGNNKNTSLHEACRNNNLEMVRLLLKKVSIESINKLNNYGLTPLYLACCNSNLEIVELLLKKGAEETINKQDRNGWTPLHCACRNNNLEMVELLLKKWAEESINKQDRNKETPLYWACKKNNLEMVRLLLEKGAIESINKSDNYGRTPIYEACRNNNLEIVRLLLEKGAIEGINMRDEAGSTPLHYACQSQNSTLGVVRELFENGALECISAQDDIELPIIHFANNQDARESINLVLEMQKSPDKVVFINNLRMVRLKDFEFLVKVLRGDLLFQLAKPKARCKELDIISRSDFYAILMDERVTKEEKMNLEVILGYKFKGLLDVYNYMSMYLEKRLPKVYKDMQRFKFVKECAKERYSDSMVFCESGNTKFEDDLEVENEGQMIGGLTELELNGIRSEADRIARQMVKFEASVSRSFALDEDQAGRIYKEQFEKVVRQLTEKRLEELAKNKKK